MGCAAPRQAALTGGSGVACRNSRMNNGLQSIVTQDRLFISLAGRRLVGRQGTTLGFSARHETLNMRFVERRQLEKHASHVPERFP